MTISEIATEFGISTALLTPFHGNGALHVPLFCAQAERMLSNGVQGVTLFGTTGEGASIGFDEREGAIRAMLASGVSPHAMTLGICACSVSDAAAQVAQGVGLGVTRFLLLPPFYFTDPDDDGLFAWHAQLFETVDKSARFILYHIPQITGIPLSLDLIMRLHAAFAERVFAIKDSAGSWENTHALLRAGALPVLVGDERLLHRALPLGAAGSICGMANLFPQRMRALFDTHAEDAALSADVGLIVSTPVVPALKHAMVVSTGNEDWANLRAPLVPLKANQRAVIAERFCARSAAQ